MEKTALKNAQKLLEDVQTEGLGLHKREERAIGWAIVAVATQIGRVATQLEVLNKEFKGRV